MREINSTQVALMMKTALDFNVKIVSLAAAYYGNIIDKRSLRQFNSELRKASDEYIKVLREIEEHDYEQTS